MSKHLPFLVAWVTVPSYIKIKSPVIELPLPQDRPQSRTSLCLPVSQPAQVQMLTRPSWLVLSLDPPRSWSVHPSSLQDYKPVIWQQLYCRSHAFRETNSLRRTMQKWSAVYDTAGPKAESPLSQRPRLAFVKIFYTPCACVWAYHSKFLETYINQGKYSSSNPIIHVLCAQTVKQLANNQ